MLNFFRNFQNSFSATSAGSIAPSGAILTLPSTPVAAGVDPLSCVITRLDQEHALELVSQQRSSNNRLTLDVSILSVTSITSTSMPTANAGMLGVGVLRGGAAVYYI